MCLLFKSEKADKISESMKNVHDGLGVQNKSDVILKEIYAW